MAADDGCRVVGYAFLFAAAMVLCLHLVFRQGTGEVPGHSVILTPRGPFILADGETDFGKLQAKPNILIIIADDMGYSDLASYGNPARQRNHIDDLASSGIRFQSVYAADSLCTPSRAGLMTGRLPVRNGMISVDGGFRVGAPTDTGGLQPEEVTIAEVLKTVGYRTGMVGKWHLGINEKTNTDGKYLPSNQGFDFVGVNLPLTNNKNCDESKYWQPNGPNNHICFLYNDTKIIQQPINFTHLTDDLLSDFNRFLDLGTNKNPFFFYFSFPQMHDALFSWKSGWDKKSETGLYGGDMLEMADAIRQMMTSLKSRDLYEDTLVLFMSDHGPHVELCTMGGATPFKGGKATSFEGGYRIPFTLSWPKMIPPGGVSRSVLSMLDLLPTFAALTGAQLPPVQLDGSDNGKPSSTRNIPFPNDPYFTTATNCLWPFASGPINSTSGPYPP